MDQPQLASPAGGVNTGNIPPQALMALQQQSGGMDIAGILAQLAQMSPEEVSSALQQLGINVDAETLHQAASDWVERAGDKAAGGDSGEGEGEQPTPQPTAPDDESAEPVADEEAPEGETAVAATPPARGIDKNERIRREIRDTPQPRQPTAPDMDLTPSGRQDYMPPVSANRLAALRGGPGSGGMNMDALISAAMSQGDPNSMPSPLRPPGAGSSPRMRGPAMPGSGTPGPAAGDNAQMRAMIGSIYRNAATDAQRGVPRGSAGASIPSATPPRGRRRNV
jgi:hypothetical protein